MLKRSEVEDTKPNSDGLALLAKKLGYDTYPQQLYFNNGATASGLFNFLDDNPGACDAVIDWVKDNYPEVIDDSDEDIEKDLEDD